MIVFEIVVALLQPALLLLIVWFIVRAVTKGGSGDGADPALTIRRVLTYGLLYLTMLVAAFGVVDLFRVVLTDRGNQSNALLARSLSFSLVGIPACVLLFRYADGRLRREADERYSPAWTIYLNVALLTTAIAAMVETHTFIRRALGSDGDPTVRSERLVGAVIWTALWAGHWIVLRRRHGIRWDLHLSVGTLIGLVPAVTGLAGLLYVGGYELYDAITANLGDASRTERGGPSAAAWLATAIVGGVAWGWFWLGHYRRSERTELWYVTVVPIGALAGFVAAVSMAATLLNNVVVWFFGNPDSTSAVRHFDLLPGTGAVLVTGTVSWLYHRSLCQDAPRRTDAIRSYDYLLSAASLVTAVVGSAVLLGALFAALSDTGDRPIANDVIAGVTMLAVGVPSWAHFWHTIEGAVRADRVHELRSPLRRIYLFGLLGASSLAALVAVLVVLTSSLEDLLDGALSRRTLHENRVGLAVLLSVVGVAVFHVRLYRSERSEHVTPPPPPLPPALTPPQPPHQAGLPVQQQVLVVASHPPEFATALTEATGAALTYWHRADGAPLPPIDIEALTTRILAQSGANLLVLIDAAGATIIPVDTRQTVVGSH